MFVANMTGHAPMRRFALTAALLCVAVAAPARAADPARAANPVRMAFQTHASFFSIETKQAKPIDPQVFVQDGLAAPGMGPQGIHHVSGVRPARLASDSPGARLVNADNQPLGFTLGQWLAAKGEVTITPSGAGALVAMSFTGLRPNAQYSLFENHFDQSPVGFTPLDGNGEANGFRTDASGKAMVTVTAPAMLTHDNAVLLILDSDGKAHGMQRGAIGVSAQHQLIARPAG